MEQKNKTVKGEEKYEENQTNVEDAYLSDGWMSHLEEEVHYLEGVSTAKLVNFCSNTISCLLSSECTLVCCMSALAVLGYMTQYCVVLTLYALMHFLWGATWTAKAAAYASSVCIHRKESSYFQGSIIFRASAVKSCLMGMCANRWTPIYHQKVVKIIC